MSYQVGLDSLNLRSAPRLAHTEYCSNTALQRRVAPADHAEGYDPRAFLDAWEVDLVWSTHDGPIVWSEQGRTTNMGHAEFLEGGVDFRGSAPCPFTDADQVWAFDAVEEYGMPQFDALVRFYEQHHRQMQRDFPEQICPGGYYRTLISGAIESFGWEMLLEAASDLTRFARVIESFYRRTLYHVQAWARTSIVAFIQHDDFVWSQGPFMDPGFYRGEIIPRYAELWKLLHAAGKKVLFCSDANWTVFLDDIASAGADGFIFEPMVPLQTVVERYGRTHAIIGSTVDCRTLTFGSRRQIRAEVDRTLELAMDCPGFFVAVGNHIPSNVPVENALYYMQCLREGWRRDRQNAQACPADSIP